MIPIRNVYYMLCYAWENTLKRDAEDALGEEAFDNVYNLLASVLLKGVKKLIKSGFARGYISCSNEIPGVKGRINLDESLKQQSMIRKQLVCDFDEYAENILMNQIVKTTFTKLMNCPVLSHQLKNDCNVVIRYFQNVSVIDLNLVNWSRLNFSRNNRNYRLIIHVCELIHAGLISTEKAGRHQFATFIKDRAMADLYEKFVFHFFREELPDYHVASSRILWKVDHVPEDDYLPGMLTDIELTKNNHKWIIDTKFYANALTSSHHSERRKLISHNLYQIFAYVKNDRFHGEISGMLLYPTVDVELEQKYVIQGNAYHVNTVNLAAPFEQIRERLLAIV